MNATSQAPAPPAPRRSTYTGSAEYMRYPEFQQAKGLVHHREPELEILLARRVLSWVHFKEDQPEA